MNNHDNAETNIENICTKHSSKGNKIGCKHFQSVDCVEISIERSSPDKPSTSKISQTIDEGDEHKILSVDSNDISVVNYNDSILSSICKSSSYTETNWESFDSLMCSSSEQKSRSTTADQKIHQILPFKLPVSILTVEIIQSKCLSDSTQASSHSKTSSTSSLKSRDHILTVVVQNETRIKMVSSNSGFIEWKEKILKIVQANSHINYIYVSIMDRLRKNSCSDHSITETTKKDGYPHAECLKLNVLQEIKNGTLFPKYYRLGNSDKEVEIDIHIDKIQPAICKWINYSEMVFCFYIKCVNINKPKYFKRRYYVRVEFKADKHRKRSVPTYQTTNPQPCINSKIVYNRWIFLKQIPENVSLIILSLIDEKTNKIKGYKLLMPIDRSLKVNTSDQSVSSIDMDMNCLYTMKPPSITNTIDEYHNSSDKSINDDDQLFHCAPSVEPPLKDISGRLSLRNHIIGNINFYYGPFYSKMPTLIDKFKKMIC